MWGGKKHIILSMLDVSEHLSRLVNSKEQQEGSVK